MGTLPLRHMKRVAEWWHDNICRDQAPELVTTRTQGKGSAGDTDYGYGAK